MRTNKKGSQSINNTQGIKAAETIISGILRSTGDTNVGVNLNVSGNAQVNRNINSNNTITAITSRAETYTRNWFRTMDDRDIYFQKYGGGWNMTNVNIIQAYGGKNIQTTAGV